MDCTIRLVRYFINENKQVKLTKKLQREDFTDQAADWVESYAPIMAIVCLHYRTEGEGGVVRGEDSCVITAQMGPVIQPGYRLDTSCCLTGESKSAVQDGLTSSYLY